MTITEELESYIEAGESVLLRGPSGIGKTDRVRTLYPDLVYIKLTNNMFPEKVVGSTNVQTGESIPPDFAKQIILDSATDEERKLVEENLAEENLAEALEKRINHIMDVEPRVGEWITEYAIPNGVHPQVNCRITVFVK